MAWTTAALQAAITALNVPGDTDAQIAALLNAQTVTGIPTSGSIPGWQFCGALNWGEVTAQTAQVQGWLQTLCGMAQVPGGSASNFVSQMFAVIGGTMPLSGAALAAIAVTIVSPVWQPPIQPNDVYNARGGV